MKNQPENVATSDWGVRWGGFSEDLAKVVDGAAPKCGGGGGATQCETGGGAPKCGRGCHSGEEGGIG